MKTAISAPPDRVTGWLDRVSVRPDGVSGGLGAGSARPECESVWLKRRLAPLADGLVLSGAGSCDQLLESAWRNQR